MWETNKNFKENEQKKKKKEKWKIPGLQKLWKSSFMFQNLKISKLDEFLNYKLKNYKKLWSFRKNWKWVLY